MTSSIRRLQLTGNDLDFIGSTLADQTASQHSIRELVSECDLQEIILDDNRLFRRILRDAPEVRISPHLYFYLLVRKALLYFGIDDRPLADQVGGILTDCVVYEITHPAENSDGRPIDFFIRAIKAMETVDEKLRTIIQFFVTNYTLLAAGISPKYVKLMNN